MLFETNFLRSLSPPPSSVQQFASQFSTFYETNIALTAIPTPITAGHRVLLEQALVAAFANPASGTPAQAANGIVSGLTQFWLGVPVPGGSVTAFLGQAPLFSQLLSQFTNPRATASQIATQMGAILKAATATVQYVIPPAPPAFLVVPP